MRLEPRLIALWCLKIYYGIRSKEHLLPRHQNNPLGARVTGRRDMEELNLLFLILQGIRTRIEYPTCEPWTIWIYRMKVPTIVAHQFSFADIVGLNMFSIRIADVGVVVMPRDFSLLQRSEFAEYFNYLLDKTLHPQQLNEVAARAAYFDRIRRIGVSYAIEFGKPVKVLWLGSMANRPWDEWDFQEFSRILSFVTKIPYEVWRPKGNLQWTLVYNDDEEFMDIPLSALPSVMRGDETWAK